jgi:hypothetical protein
MTEQNPNPGDIVVLRATEDAPRHLFEVQKVHDDLITGVALTGPLRGCYGEPDLELIEAILRF